MSTNNNVQIVQCSICSASNRVDQSSAKTPVCGRCKTPLPNEDQPFIVTDANFPSLVDKSPLPLLIDFWAVWCGPCRMVAPVIDALARETVGKLRVGKLNVDENPMTAARFRVQSIPTLLVLQNGREIDRFVGAQSKEAILRRLQPYI